MDRSFAAGGPAQRRHTGRPRKIAAPDALVSGLRALPAAARRGLGGAPAALALLRAHRRLRIAAICLVLALPLLGGGWLWLRHSSLVAVQHVSIVGVHGPEAHAIEISLREAAKGMSTLDAQPSALRAAVARFPAVSSVRATASFPHGMRIVVTQLPAVAALLVGGTRTAVAGDGTVLGTSLVSSSLPTVADDVAPGSGTHLRNPLVLEALAVLGAAPPALDRLAEKAWFAGRGLTVQMRGGLLVYFGDASRPHAKWLSLASVLADKSSAGATYVDVRLPGRPAAGFPPGAAPLHTEEAATGEASQSKSESTVSALAAGLSAANPEAKKEASKSEGEGEAATPEGSESSGSGEANEEASAGGEAPSTGTTSGG
jgi:cell division protein FtsQ